MQAPVLDAALRAFGVLGFYGKTSLATAIARIVQTRTRHLMIQALVNFIPEKNEPRGGLHVRFNQCLKESQRVL
jgi:hypothetical protein